MVISFPAWLLRFATTYAIAAAATATIKTITNTLTLKVLRLRGELNGAETGAIRGLFLALFIFLCRLTGTETVPSRGDWESRYTSIVASVQVVYKLMGSIMKIHKLTYALLILVFATLGLTFGRNQNSGDAAKANEYKNQLAARSQRFPTAAYEEPDLADPRKDKALKEKKIRKNDYKLVARNPPSWQAERVVINEGGIDFPALPVAQSTLIVLGKVTAAEAHVSENKKNVYSEFTVLVEKVLKSSSSLSVEGSEITVDRVGGFVKYPNGHTVLYRISGTNMPLAGERYLLFLTSSKSDISILTAYELGLKGVTPLDDSSQFEQYRGLTETALLDKLREAFTTSPPQ